MPVCRKCNESKRSHDTKKEPIVNPSIEDPEKILCLQFLDIEPIGESNVMAKKTIEVCDLNSERLYDARARLLHPLSSYQKQTERWINEIDFSDTPRKRINKIKILRDSVEILEKLMSSEETFAGFSRFF